MKSLINPCIHLRKGAGKELAKMVFNPANIIGIEILPALEKKHKETSLHKLGRHKKVKVCLFPKKRKKK